MSTGESTPEFNTGKSQDLVRLGAEPDLSLDELADGLTLQRVSEYLCRKLSDEKKLEMMFALARTTKKGYDEAVVLLGIFDIRNTHSVFKASGDAEQKRKREILEAVAAQYPFRFWLQSQNIKTHEATRVDFMNWWSFFTNMCAHRGFTHGTIDNTVQKNNLWKATADLAQKMRDNPADYGFLPGYLVNHPELVREKLMGGIKASGPWAEILIGDTIDNMSQSPVFMEACSIIDKEIGDSPFERAIATIALIFSRPSALTD